MILYKVLCSAALAPTQRRAIAEEESGVMMVMVVMVVVVMVVVAVAVAVVFMLLMMMRPHANSRATQFVPPRPFGDYPILITL